MSGKLSEKSVIDVGDAALRREVNRAIDAIAKVHSVSRMPNVVIRDQLMEDGYGEFNPNTNIVNLDPRASYQQVATIHELAHMLEHHALPPDSLDTWFEAVQDSPSYRSLFGLRVGDVVRVGDLDIEVEGGMLGYLANYREVWARSYTQYIATKTQSERLLEQIKEIQSTEIPMQYWDKEEFEPIMNEIEKLFGGLGWLK